MLLDSPTSFAIPTGLLRLIAYIYSFIGFCSAVTIIHPKLRQPSARKIRQAINSWWPPALIGGVATVLGASGAVFIFALISAWALREYLGLLPASDRSPLTDFIAYATVPLHYAVLYWGSEKLFLTVILFWIFGVLPLARAFAAGPAGTLGALPRLQFGLILTVFALSHVARLFLLVPAFGPLGGTGLAALFLLCVMANDAAQYLFGKLFGRHRLIPKLSPNKTWEGLAGGLLVTALVAAGASSLVTPFTRPEAALLGIAFSLLGLLGDLLVSAIKRDAGVKDTGAVLPGQGGVLDRCDSMLLTAPLFVHVVIPWLK